MVQRNKHQNLLKKAFHLISEPLLNS